MVAFGVAVYAIILGLITLSGVGLVVYMVCTAYQLKRTELTILGVISAAVIFVNWLLWSGWAAVFAAV